MLPILQRRAGLIALLLCSAASAQEITGLITEAGSTPSLPGLAIADATVELTKISSPDFERTRAGTTTTDGNGAFHFHLAEFGTYFVWATKDGYTWRGGTFLEGGPSRSAEVTLDAAHPTSKVRFVLARDGQITGRLIDEETGQPISGLTITAAASYYNQGKRMALSHSAGKTERDGQFALTSLSPGNYLVTNGPRSYPYGALEMLQEFSEDDRKVVEQEYQWGFWPGGPDLVSALPVSVGPGQSVDLGTMRLRKVTSYRAHVSLSAENCAPDEKVDVTVFSFFGFDKSMDELGSVPCGGTFLVRNFQPGRFWIASLGKKQDGQEKLGLAEFEVRDQNLDITVAEEHGTSVDGRVIFAEGASHPLMDQIEISLNNSVDTGLHPGGFAGPGKPDANGKFRIEDVELGRWLAGISGLDGGFYVKEVRYNQVAVSDGVISVSGPGTLEIVVDDKATAIGGVVANGSEPVTRPVIMLAKWPPNPESVFLSTSNTTGDDDGRFQLLGLAPGEYRILAVSDDALQKLHEPGILERLLSRAETVKLEPTVVRELHLKLVDPTR